MKPRSETTQLVRLALPISLAHLVNIAMQVVDMAFVGRLGATSLGGLSIGNSIFAPVMISCVGLLMGLDYLLSHAFGSKQREQGNHLFIQAIYLATLASIPAIAFMHVAPAFFERFGIAPEVASEARAYLHALSWSLWPWLVVTAFRQLLQSLGNAMPVLIAVVLANFVNAGGNWLLIYGNWGFPKLGIAGSGVATLIARIFTLAALVGYVAWKNRRDRLGLLEARASFDGAAIVRIIKLGAPVGGQVLLEVGVFAASTLLAGRLGTIPLAAHQIVLQLVSVTFMIPLGLASACAVRVASALGAGNRALARHAASVSLTMGSLFMALCGIALFLLDRPLLGLFTADAEVLHVASGLLLAGAFFQIFDGAQVVEAGMLRGLGNTRASLLANLIGHWLLGLPIGAALCFGAGWGVFGLWVGLSIGLTFVAIALFVVWKGAAREVEEIQISP